LNLLCKCPIACPQDVPLSLGSAGVQDLLTSGAPHFSPRPAMKAPKSHYKGREKDCQHRGNDWPGLSRPGRHGRWRRQRPGIIYLQADPDSGVYADDIWIFLAKEIIVECGKQVSFPS